MEYRRPGKTLLLPMIVVCLLWAIPAAALDTNIRIVRLSFVSGDVQLDRGQGQGFERAILNTPIVQGSRLSARGDDALAEVEFEDGSTLRLTPGSTVEFRELSLRDSGQRVSSVELVNGTAYFDIRNHAGEFHASFGGHEISVPRSARFRVLGADGEFKVAVYHGEVSVRNGDREVEVSKGETYALDANAPGQYNLAKSIAEGSYDDWNQQRQNYTESNTTANAYSAGNSFSPAYSYGLSDLAYYGNYFYAPGFGWAWQPYYAGAGWNPFFDGAWMWYPQFGYAFVSPYPWGWMPYRYGSWNFIPGYGWGWMPGGAWNTWTTVPMVSRAPVSWVALSAPAAPVAGAPSTVAVGRVWGAVYPTGSAHPLLARTLLSTDGAGAAPRVWRFSGARANFMANGIAKQRAAAARPPAGMMHPVYGSPFASARGGFPGFAGHASAGAGHGGGGGHR